MKLTLYNAYLFCATVDENGIAVFVATCASDCGGGKLIRFRQVRLQEPEYKGIVVIKIAGFIESVYLLAKLADGYL